MEIFTQSVRETKELGQKIAADLLLKERGIYATVLALSGELGSGKTTFVQGFARSLGLPQRILSPTFMIIREYKLNQQKFARFCHIDLYWIVNTADLTDLGIWDIFADPTNILAIEWAEKMEKMLPHNRVDIAFAALDSGKRRISIAGSGL